MIQFLSRLFSSAPKPDFKSLHQEGAYIIDVRTKGEFSRGNISTSVNIPVDQLHGHKLLPKTQSQTIITCCASGMRSAAAAKALKNMGFSSVHNGGSWQSLQREIE